jgi:hypothetical protein
LATKNPLGHPAPDSLHSLRSSRASSLVAAVDRIPPLASSPVASPTSALESSHSYPFGVIIPRVVFIPWVSCEVVSSE